MEGNTILEFRNITKKYPGTVALDNVSISFRQGEVHALCGENGAGKSTLIKTCSGAISPTEGEIIIDGKRYTKLTPSISQQLGIAVIYQEFNLVNQLSVAENIFLGCVPRKGIVPDVSQMNQRTKDIFNRFHLPINPKTSVEHLSIGYQQMVEIAKAVSKNAKVLIMDEPTAPLTTSEVGILMQIIQTLKREGVTIIYISHRLEEIFQISDRVSVLRDGKLITTMKTSETNKDELIRNMVGREFSETYPKRPDVTIAETVLETKNLTGNGVNNVSINVRKGEILAIAGIMGAGRTEFAQLLFGAKKIDSGEIIFKGQKVRPKSPADASKIGIALVPEDRKQQGVLLNMTIKDNISLASIKRISKGSFIEKLKEMEIVEKYEKSLRIKTPSVNHLVNSLSGGNQQKVVLAKWLATEPDVIIMDEPTRGIDVGAKHEIYTLMNELVRHGKAIIMITSEMEELIAMADRIVVLSEGVQTAELGREDFSEETILRFASKAGGKIA